MEQMGAEKSLILKPAYIESAIAAEGMGKSKQQVAADAFDLLKTSAEQLSASEIQALLGLAGDLIESKEAIGLLNHLLLLRNHQCHEDIAISLQRLRDPSSIPNLAAAIEQDFDFYAWDEGKAFVRKCMWALGKIGTDQAWSEIEQFSKAQDPVIARWAKEQLDGRT